MVSVIKIMRILRIIVFRSFLFSINGILFAPKQLIKRQTGIVCLEIPSLCLYAKILLFKKMITLKIGKFDICQKSWPLSRMSTLSFFDFDLCINSGKFFIICNLRIYFSYFSNNLINVQNLNNFMMFKFYCSFWT